MLGFLIYLKKETFYCEKSVSNDLELVNSAIVLVAINVQRIFINVFKLVQFKQKKQKQISAIFLNLPKRFICKIISRVKYIQNILKYI